MKRLFPLLFLGIGLAALILAGVLVFRTAQFVSHATATEGKVVAMESSRSGRIGRSRRTSRPVFEFKDSAGKIHRVTESVGSSPPAFTSGEKVVVLYESGLPEAARIRAFSTLWLGPILAAGFGVIFTFVGFSARKVGKHSGRREGPRPTPQPKLS